MLLRRTTAPPRTHGEGRRARDTGTESRGTRARESQEAVEDALVLGGGGFTGGVYEIGALRALDLLAVNRTINGFDVYVGTSAGAFVRAWSPTGSRPRR